MMYARCLCVCGGGGACPFSFSMWIEVLVVISILNVHQCNPRHYIHSEPVKHQQDERETAKGIKLNDVLLLTYYRNQLKELNWSRWLRIFILPHAIYNVYIIIKLYDSNMSYNESVNPFFEYISRALGFL